MSIQTGYHPRVTTEKMIGASITNDHTTKIFANIEIWRKIPRGLHKRDFFGLAAQDMAQMRNSPSAQGPALRRVLDGGDDSARFFRS